MVGCCYTCNDSLCNILYCCCSAISLLVSKPSRGALNDAAAAAQVLIISPVGLLNHFIRAAVPNEMSVMFVYITPPCYTSGKLT